MSYLLEECAERCGVPIVKTAYGYGHITNLAHRHHPARPVRASSTPLRRADETPPSSVRQSGAALRREA